MVRCVQIQILRTEQTVVQQQRHETRGTKPEDLGASALEDGRTPEIPCLYLMTVVSCGS
jgi:hypothetical protein